VVDGEVIFLKIEDTADLAAVSVGLGVDPYKALVVSVDKETEAEEVPTPVSKKVV
jgi:hypothetical protein